MGWIKQVVVNLIAVVAVVVTAASVDAQVKPATAPTLPRVAKSAYWDKPLVLPPNVDDLLLKLPAPVAQWVIKWKANELAGKSATNEQIAELNQLINELPTPVDYLAPLVAIIANLDGNKTALPLCDSVLKRAEIELKPFAPGEPAVKPAVDALWLLHPVLWDSKQYAIDQKLLELVRPWEVYGSAHSQLASYLYAETLYLQDRGDAAYDAFKQVEAERAVATEPSEGLNRSLDWPYGLTLFYAERYAEAAPYFEKVINSNQSEERQSAHKLLVLALALSHRPVAAKERWSDYCRSYEVSRSESLDILVRIEQAKLK